MERAHDKKYTYADYLTWDDDVRCELIDGEVFMMSAPTVDHQEISMSLASQLYNYLKGKTCKVYAAPFDVRLNADAEDDTVVQPDISVICDPNKTSDRKSCKGAPDMIIEILSPSTESRDQVIKFNKYLEAGVREYWVVNPAERFVQVHVLENGKYVSQAYGSDAVIPVYVLDDCQIDLGDVFPALPEPEAAESVSD